MTPIKRTIHREATEADKLFLGVIEEAFRKDPHFLEPQNFDDYISISREIGYTPDPEIRYHVDILEMGGVL